MIHEIRPGDRIEYGIVRHKYGSYNRYRVRWRNPDTLLVLRQRWWQLWRPKTSWNWLMEPGLYCGYIAQYSSCHDAEAAIDSDVRERIGRTEGWVPVRCADEGADNH